jgi:Domain of unknown function (DUF6265)
MRSLLISLCVCLFACPVFAADSLDVRQLAWLEGSWTGTHDGVAMEEHWTGASGGALLGMHRDVKAGRMTSFEFLRIQTTADGIFYFASPGSAAPIAFKLLALTERHVTFENKAHDFPQRIEYWLDAADVLHARIEGPVDGKNVSEEWAWKRAQQQGQRR